MKKTIVFLFFFFTMNMLFSQTSNFNVYLKNGKQNINELKEEELGELRVSVPIPDNVANYDLFIVSLCYGDCGFNKTTEYVFNKDYVKANLNNQKHTDLLILNNSQPRSTNFGYPEVVHKELFVYPRNIGKEKFRIIVKTEVQNILSWETETKYDEHLKRYVETTTPIYSGRIVIASTEFYTLQTSLSEGVSDAKGNIKVKLPNPEKSIFMDYKTTRAEYESGILVKDNSEKFETMICIYAYDKSKFSTEALKADLLSFTKLLKEPKLDWESYTSRKLGKRNDFNNEKKTDNFSEFEIGNHKGSSFEWYSLPYTEKNWEGYKAMTGAYAKFYFFETETFSYLAYFIITDQLSEKGKKDVGMLPVKNIKPEWYDFMISVDDAKKAEKVFEQLFRAAELK